MSDYFDEMAKLLGFEVQYQYPINPELNLYGQMSSDQYSIPINTNIVYEENPKLATLKALGWVSETPDDKPIIAHVSYSLKNLQVNGVFTIPSTNKLHKARKFKVTGIYSINQYPDCWVCTLAPIFDKPVPQTDYHASNYNYIDESVADHDRNHQ